MPESKEIKILIADDHFVVRSGLAAMVEAQQDMTVVAEAANGLEAVIKYQEMRPDVVLMDLQMPEVDGATAIKSIKNDFPKAKIIVLTTYDGDEDIFRALKVGAAGYLLKDAERSEILSAIRTVNSGQKYLNPNVALKLAERVQGNDLTNRELEILQGILDGQSNKEIGSELHISEGTVKNHINSILGKLNVADRTQAALTAIRRGLLRLKS
jgi:two-component system, NarL family, response regulator